MKQIRIVENGIDLGVKAPLNKKVKLDRLVDSKVMEEVLSRRAEDAKRIDSKSTAG